MKLFAFCFENRKDRCFWAQMEKIPKFEFKSKRSLNLTIQNGKDRSSIMVAKGGSLLGSTSIAKINMSVQYPPPANNHPPPGG